MAVCDPLQPAVPGRELKPEPTPEAAATHAATKEQLEQLIGHAFADPELLSEALTHPSVVGDQPKKRARGRLRRRRSYQRLEFLGDRVLGLIIADWLWQLFKSEPEGDLTRRFHQLVRQESLAHVAAAIGLDRHIELSRIAQIHGTSRKESVLADSCEAVIGAIYIDGGLEPARNFIRHWWEPLVAEMKAPPRDPKEHLQERAYAHGLPLPIYEVRAETGPDHARKFTVVVKVSGFGEALATASSKRGAEIGAAATLLERLPAVASGGAKNARRKQGRR